MSVTDYFIMLMIFCFKIQSILMRQEVRTPFHKSIFGLWDICSVFTFAVFTVFLKNQNLKNYINYICIYTTKQKNQEIPMQLHFLSWFGVFIGEQPFKTSRESTVAVRYVSDLFLDSGLWPAEQVSCRVYTCEGFCCCRISVLVSLQLKCIIVLW